MVAVAGGWLVGFSLGAAASERPASLRFQVYGRRSGFYIAAATLKFIITTRTNNNNMAVSEQKHSKN